MVSNNAKLTNFDQLSSLVDLDQNPHALKSIAQSLLNASGDWPTYNKSNIFEFIQELKDYYGIPLTENRIQRKLLSVSDNNAWRHEAGVSIIEMINLSQKAYSESDFDIIVQKLLSYYQQQLGDIDFIADLKFLSTEEGGRSTPVFSGYRPQVKFEFDKMQTSGQQTFLNKETVYPGDSVKATIRLLSVEHFANSLNEGVEFELREGSRIIGTGIITNILNTSLMKACR